MKCKHITTKPLGPIKTNPKKEFYNYKHLHLKIRKQTNKKAPQNSKSLLGHVHTDINSTTVRQAHKIKKKIF